VRRYPPGAGKSTFSQNLAVRLGVNYFERDSAGTLGSAAYQEAVAKIVGRSDWVFDGFPYFRRRARLCGSRLGDRLALRARTRALAGRGPLPTITDCTGGCAPPGPAARYWRARIAEIDGLAFRPELAGKSIVVLRSPAAARRMLATCAGYDQCRPCVGPAQITGILSCSRW
jgi:hypothetical protein